MAYAAVLIDPKDPDYPEVFGPHASHSSATWHAENVLAARHPVEWADTCEFIENPVDACAHDVVNAWNEVASRCNYLPYLRVVEMSQ